MDEIQALCETGQEQLMRLAYWPAEKTLERAEELALQRQDFDALARLYMPLQEARRQRRQRCGEGAIRLHILAAGPNDPISAEKLATEFPRGQLLVAGWRDLRPATDLRRIARERELYLETFLATVSPTKSGLTIVIYPLQGPDHAIVLTESQIPPETYGDVMNLWERLHAPFLAAADAEKDLRKKIAAYRRTIQVDYACELAHQNLAAAAAGLSKET
jgi:hypothetical protein